MVVVKERLVAIEEVLRQRGKFHDCSLDLNCIQRWFYTLKAVICLLLNRRKNFGFEDIDSMVVMAVWNMTEWQSPDFMGTAYDWTELVVGIGIFKEWYFDICRNGSV